MMNADHVDASSAPSGAPAVSAPTRRGRGVFPWIAAAVAGLLLAFAVMLAFRNAVVLRHVARNQQQLARTQQLVIQAFKAKAEAEARAREAAAKRASQPTLGKTLDALGVPGAKVIRALESLPPAKGPSRGRRRGR